jgi:hypothetical protein
MPAFQISLTRRTTAVDLLFTGCIGDVFATFPLQDRKKGNAVTTPLLQNMQALGVRDETVISAAEQKERNTPFISRRSGSPGGDVTVALEVTPRQAAALQLSMERGTLGLAMRDPRDKNLNPTEPMILKEGQLTASSGTMDPQTPMLVNQLQEMLGNKPPADVNQPPMALTRVDAGVNMAPLAAGPASEYPEIMSPRRSTWLMAIIQGPKVEEAELKSGDTVVGPEDADAPAPANRTEKTTGTEEARTRQGRPRRDRPTGGSRVSSGETGFWVACALPYGSEKETMRRHF